MPKKGSKVRKVFYLIILAVIICGGTCGFFLYYLNNSFYNYKREYKNLTITVDKKNGITKVLSDLGIKNIKAYRYFLRVKRMDSKLKAGDYYFNGSYTLNEVFTKIIKGDSERVKILIPEGFTLQQIKDRLISYGLIDSQKFDLALSNHKDFYYLPADGNFEGFLFPDTYFFSRKQDEEDIVNAMLGRFLQKYPPEIYKDKNSFYQSLILASIIEKEGYHQEEKPIIASVFLNRIKKNMRLESCATVEYLYNYSKPRLFYKDLEIDSPYNTYRHKGLPPGPISNPGVNSINAALKPSKTEFLYFVAGEDRRHTFSKDYKDHLEAKSKMYEEFKGGN